MRIRHVAGRMLLVLLLAGLLAGVLRGDPGVSPSLRRVGELLAERLPVTLRGVGLGLACGWFMALSLAGPAALSRTPFFDRFGSALSGVFLCLPSAVFAALLLLAGGPGSLAIGFVVFPRNTRGKTTKPIASEPGPPARSSSAANTADGRQRNTPLKAEPNRSKKGVRERAAGPASDRAMNQPHARPSPTPRRVTGRRSASSSPTRRSEGETPGSPRST